MPDAPTPVKPRRGGFAERSASLTPAEACSSAPGRARPRALLRKPSASRLHEGLLYRAPLRFVVLTLNSPERKSHDFRYNWSYPRGATLMTRLAACALLLSVGLVARAAEEALKPILDLHKSNKLFEKSDYKAVRAAAAKVFETRNADQIKDAFGPDQEVLSAWLEKQKDLKEEFFSAIDPGKDDVRRVLEIFHDLWKEN